MAKSIKSRLTAAWDVFKSKNDYSILRGGGYGGRRPDRGSTTRNYTTRTSFVNTIYNRLAMDVASINIRHIKSDVDSGLYLETVKSELNQRLSLDANIDQTGRALIQDIVMSLLEEGSIAVVPVETTVDPLSTETYTIHSLRVGKILDWYPAHIRVDLYNDRTGQHEQVIVPKETTAIIENPLYSVTNQPNSSLQRLLSKINLLDTIESRAHSGKLDIIIQLPYAAKTKVREQLNKQRQEDIEEQLQSSAYGIAYIEGNEKITQLNRPAENNLLAQIEYLYKQVYAELGLSEGVFNGTASEQEQINYFNRSIEPFLSAITLEFTRTFLSKTARTQGQRIDYYRDPFKLIPVSMLAEVADKFTRNEILSSNEVRGIINYRPSKDPKADELRNKNLNQQDVPEKKTEEPVEIEKKEEEEPADEV